MYLAGLRESKKNLRIAEIRTLIFGIKSRIANHNISTFFPSRPEPVLTSSIDNLFV
jgi:hypothetical protein